MNDINHSIASSTDQTSFLALPELNLTVLTQFNVDSCSHPLTMHSIFKTLQKRILLLFFIFRSFYLALASSIHQGERRPLLEPSGTTSTRVPHGFTPIDFDLNPIRHLDIVALGIIATQAYVLRTYANAGWFRNVGRKVLGKCPVSEVFAYMRCGQTKRA